MMTCRSSFDTADREASIQTPQQIGPPQPDSSQRTPVALTVGVATIGGRTHATLVPAQLPTMSSELATFFNAELGALVHGVPSDLGRGIVKFCGSPVRA
jgi:hypothetical protein